MTALLAILTGVTAAFGLTITAVLIADLYISHRNERKRRR